MTSGARQPNFLKARAAAGVLFLDENDRVHMVVPSYKNYLDLPGGYVEPGETPREAAVREVREELGIEPRIGRLLVADWWRDSVDGFGGPKLLLVFEGGYLSASDIGEIVVDGDEIVDHAFHLVAELNGVTIPRLANRIEHAVRAHQDGSTCYLEDGT